MKKLFTVLALCATVLAASATDTPKAKKAAKAPVKKETCAKADDCCKKAGTAAVAPKKAVEKKS